MGDTLHWLFSSCLPKGCIAACYAAAAVYLVRKYSGRALALLLFVSIALVASAVMLDIDSNRLSDATFFIAVIAISLLGPAAFSVAAVAVLSRYYKLSPLTLWSIATAVGAVMAIGVTQWGNSLWV